MLHCDKLKLVTSVLDTWPLALNQHSCCLTAEDELFSCLLPFTLNLSFNKLLIKLFFFQKLSTARVSDAES